MASRITSTPNLNHHTIYAELESFGRERLAAAGRGKQQISNFVAALSSWRRIADRSIEKAVGEDFADAFDTLFAHYQDAIAEELGQRTQKDRIEQVLWWRKTWRSLCDHDTLPLEFSEALSLLFERSGLTKAAICRYTGLSLNTLKRWLSGEHLPERQSAHLVTAFERVLGVKEGILLRRLPARRRARYARGQQENSRSTLSQYGKRLVRNKKKLPKYSIKPTNRLVTQWQEVIAFKTDTSRDGATARNCWRLRPHERVGARIRWYMYYDGMVCVTAGVQYGQLANYLGYLALPKSQGGQGLSADQVDTLAWLVRADYVEAYIRWQRRRADGILHHGLHTFLEMVRSHLHPAHGFIALHPELAATLPTGECLSETSWQQRCDSAHKALLQFTRKLNAEGKPKKSRDPRELIADILASQFPIKELARLVKSLENDPPPIAHRRDYAVWLRDVLLLKMLLHYPMRASNFSIMTFRGLDANLRRAADGSWQLSYPPSEMKNEKGAASEPYVVTVAPAIVPWLIRYLAEARPHLVGASSCDYLFLPSVVGNRRNDPVLAEQGYERAEDWKWAAECISCRVRYVTARYSNSGVGFGIHAFRHIVATDHLKRHPQDYVTVAKMLNDSLATVLEEYGHLEAEDGTRAIRSSIEQAEKELAREQGDAAA